MTALALAADSTASLILWGVAGACLGFAVFCVFVAAARWLDRIEGVRPESTLSGFGQRNGERRSRPVPTSGRDPSPLARYHRRLRRRAIVRHLRGNHLK